MHRPPINFSYATLLTKILILKDKTVGKNVQ
jgi:hypothetical protein